MTLVIGPRAGCAYARGMQPSSGQSTLAALLQEQRALEDRICGSELRPEDALAAGRTLLAFAEREGILE